MSSCSRTPAHAVFPAQSRRCCARVAATSRWQPTNADLNVVWPVRPNPGTNRAYQAGIDRADGTLARFTAVCAPLVYRGDRLPAELYGNVVRRRARRQFRQPDRADRRRHDAAGTKGVRQRASSWRRPTSASARSTSPTRPTARCTSSTCIAASSSTACRHHRCICAITSWRASWTQPIGLGRIYRVVHETTRRDTEPALAKARRRSSSRRCRTRTAGGATPRSGCWSSAARSPWCRRW